MGAVDVIILHPLPAPGAGPLERALADARSRLAEDHRVGFGRAGAATVRIVAGDPDDRPFGSRLHALVDDRQPDRGLVLLGSGAIPLATAADRRAFVGAASADDRRALANNRFSADVVALSASAAAGLADLPADFPADNALPRWLAEVGGVAVADLRARWRLAMDLDLPLDVLLVAGARRSGAGPVAAPRRTPLMPAALQPAVDRIHGRFDLIRRVFEDPRAELVVAGRTSSATVGWLERNARCRVRALVEERGLRARARSPRLRSLPRGSPRPQDRRSAAPVHPRHGPRPGRTGRARSPARRARRRGARGQSRAAGRSIRAGRGDVARSRCAVRVGPARRGRRGRPVAGGRDGVGGGRVDPGPAGRPLARRTRCPPDRRRDLTAMDPIEAGLRPLADPPPLPTEGEPRLVERIRAEIDRDGPLTFDRFMAMALYEPELGYYRTSDDRATRAGDFLTAPETHPIFGAAIARQLDEVRRRLGAPGRFVVREYGAGSGALGLGILEAVTGRGVLGRVAGSTDLAAALVYAPIEVDRERRDAIVGRLTAAGFGPSLEPDLPPDRGESGATLANEFLDALPVHRVIGRAGGLRELAVGWSAGRFVEVEMAPSSPALEARLAADGVVLADGARAEICLELDRLDRRAGGGSRARDRDWSSTTATRRPSCTTRPAPAGPCGPTRASASTPTGAIAVGRQDLTAHVDFSAVDRAARRARSDRRSA